MTITIPSKHEIGDRVWFFSRKDCKIRIGTIKRPEYFYTNQEINWVIEGYNSKGEFITEEVMDYICFKTKEELINYLTDAPTQS